MTTPPSGQATASSSSTIKRPPASRARVLPPHCKSGTGRRGGSQAAALRTPSEGIDGNLSTLGELHVELTAVRHERAKKCSSPGRDDLDLPLLPVPKDAGRIHACVDRAIVGQV